MKTLSILSSILLLVSCASVKKWEAAHASQIQQTAFLIAQDIGQTAVRLYLGGTDANGKFTFAAGIRSLENNYVTPQQLNDLITTWGITNPQIAKAASFIAADLANHPPTNQAMALARLEGYISGIAPVMGVTPPASTTQIATAPKTGTAP
jgi:hypothetical protein